MSARKIAAGALGLWLALCSPALAAAALVTLAPDAGPTTGIAPIATSAAASALVVKSSPGNLYGFSVTSGASAGFVLVFNATAAPADGAVTPAACYAIAANSSLSVSWQPGPPLWLDTGITLVFSTTGCFTKTASATAFISAQAM